MSTIKLIFRDYFLHASFHGYRYIVEKERHITERIFWIIICTMSWTASLLLIRNSWYNFQNNAISFVVDTNYLEWDTKFPAITVCETDNLEKISDVTDRIFGDPHDYNLDEIVKELVFYKGLSFYTLQTCGPETKIPDGNCFKKNFTFFQKEVRSTCNEIFKSCIWNKKPFDCCKYFAKMDTEIGRCYSLNSIQISEFKPKFEMISNKEYGPGSLILELHGILSVYILGEQEVPSLTTLATDYLQITPHIKYTRHFAIKEIDNQPEVKEVSISQRKCRFPTESNLDVYKSYSFSACCVQCRKEAQLNKCGCAHHLMPNTNTSRMCNITGLDCLNKNYNDLAILKPYWSNRTGLVCDCMPSCTEVEFEVITDTKTGISQENSIVELNLERLPTERFKRNVVKGKLDLVVSMGGATALFLGASLLSFVEILYYFLIRPISDYYLKKCSA